MVVFRFCCARDPRQLVWRVKKFEGPENVSCFLTDPCRASRQGPARVAKSHCWPGRLVDLPDEPAGVRNVWNRTGMPRNAPNDHIFTYPVLTPFPRA